MSKMKEYQHLMGSIDDFLIMLSAKLELIANKDQLSITCLKSHYEGTDIYTTWCNNIKGLVAQTVNEHRIKESLVKMFKVMLDLKDIKPETV